VEPAAAGWLAGWLTALGCRPAMAAGRARLITGRKGVPLQLVPFGEVAVCLSARSVPLDYVAKLALSPGVRREKDFFEVMWRGRDEQSAAK
jgi:hypothetical protein